MAAKSIYSSSKRRPFIFFLILFSIALVFLTSFLREKPNSIKTNEKFQKEIIKSKWYETIVKELKGLKNIKIGLVNVNHNDEALHELHGLANSETVLVKYEQIGDNRKWEEFFPEWIDEDQKWKSPKCPSIPMPKLQDYKDLDLVVARVPCGKNWTTRKGIRDVFRLQVNLVVANLLAESRWLPLDVEYGKVYVVFIGSCGPMVEIFRCDDQLVHQGDYWVYKPEMKRLKQKVLMPVGSCQLAPAYAQTGKEIWRPSNPQPNKTNSTQHHNYRPRYAYITVLHSSEDYVCGAIALAQSIKQTNSSKDLVLLVDESISSKSIEGLRAAGWLIFPIQRIYSPFAQMGSYNEWNYSKLRIWQLTYYEKLIFIDADLLVLRNIDSFFIYPQLSASANNKVLFNSGFLVIEPSTCLFEDMMKKTFKLESYNGGDQGFLNEYFTWWHRLPKKLNYLKAFVSGTNLNHKVSEDVYAIHYLGWKPWMCYKDYDCNWDVWESHEFASDSAHQKWWQVFDKMPKRLQAYCGLTKKMDQRIRNSRIIAKNDGLADGHWKILPQDPRQYHFVD